VLGIFLELRAISTFQSRDMAGKFDARHLHAKANAKEGNLVFAGIFDGQDHALGTAHTKATGHQHTVAIAELCCGAVDFDILTLDPLQVHLHFQAVARMVEGFDQAFVALLEFHVLAHHADAHAALGVANAVQQVLPTAEIGLGFR